MPGLIFIWKFWILMINYGMKMKKIQKQCSLLFLLFTLSVGGCASQKLTLARDSDSPDPRAMDLFLEGLVWELKQNPAAALLAYQEALLYDPQAVTIYKRIGKNYLWMGKTESAFRVFQHALGLNPKDVETHLLIAQIDMEQGDWISAEKALHTILSIDSTHFEAEYQLALLYLRTNQLDRAINFYRRLLRHSDSFDSRLYVTLGNLYLRQKKFKEAEDAFRQILQQDSLDVSGLFGIGMVKDSLKDTLSAMAWYEKALQLDPDFEEVRDRLAEIYQEQKHWEKAIALCRERIALDSTKIENWLSLCDVYRNAEDSISALALAKEIISRFPDQWQAYLSYGRLLMDYQKPKEAYEQFQKVVSLAPDNFWGLAFSGISLVHQDSLTLAISWFQKALSLVPEDPLVNYYLGTVLVRLKKPKEAIPYLEISIQARPNWVNALSALAGAYESIGEYARADSFYTRALQQDPENPLVLNNYGYSLSVRGVRLEEAMAMSKKALEKDPENGAYLDTMGWIYFKMGDYEKAREYIEKACQFQKNSAEIYEHLGDIYEKLMMKEEAIQMWEKALELDRGNLQLLKKLGRVPSNTPADVP